MIHTKSKKIQEAYSKYYARLFNNTIHDVYANPSNIKVQTFNKICYYYSDVSIISYNTFTYTCGAKLKYNGRMVFVWITPEHTRYIYFDELVEMGYPI